MKTKNHLSKIFSEIYLLTKLELSYKIGLFNSKASLLHDYFIKSWLLGHSNVNDISLFRNHTDRHIDKAINKLRWYNELKEHKYYKWIIGFYLITVVIVIILKFVFPYQLLYNISDIILLLFMVLSVLSIPFLQLFYPSEKKISSYNRYLSILNDYKSSKDPLRLLKQPDLILYRYKKIVLSLNTAELSSVLGSMLRNNIISGLTASDIAYFIEENCRQSDGKSYENLNQRISQYRTIDKNSQTALDSFINKINQNT